MARGYQIIYCDPPWDNGDWAPGSKTKSVSAHYPTATIAQMVAWAPQFEALKNSMGAPCAIFMWAQLSKLPGALRVMEAWGFRYATAPVVWGKLNADGSMFSGIGTHAGGNAEVLLMGQAVGRVALKPARPKPFSNLLLTGRLAHSEKPEEVAHRLVTTYGDLPRVEVFARRQREGWDTLGNEIDGRFIDGRTILDPKGGNYHG